MGIDEAIMWSPTALVIGDSPTLIYLTSCLAKANWKVTTLPYTDKNYSKDNNATTIHSAYRDTIVFTSTYSITNLIELSTVVNSVRGQHGFYNYIILNAKFMEFLCTAPEFFKDVMDRNTLVFYDCTGYFLDYSMFQIFFPNNCTLSVFSDIDCRLVDRNTNSYQMMSDTNKILIGNSFKQVPLNTAHCLNLKGPLGVALSHFVASISLGNASVEVLRACSHKTLSTSIWDNITNKLCLGALTIIFEEPDAQIMASDYVVVPVLKGLFKEVLSISTNQVNKRESDIKASLNMLLQNEIETMNYRRSLVLSKPCLPMFMFSNTEFFNFSQGHETCLIKLFETLLNLADYHHIDVPFAKSIFSFLCRLKSTRDGCDHHGQYKPSAIFQAKNSRNEFLKMDTVNGINPRHNMMNFPPFYPIAEPQNLVVLLASVDLEMLLEELLIGVEEMTYGGVLEPALEDTASAKPASEELIYTPPSREIQILPDPLQFQSLELLQIQAQLLTQQLQLQAQLLELQQLKSRPNSSDVKHYHHPTKISRNTSTAKLKESHFGVMESARFDEAIGTSRYGSVDTTTAYLIKSGGTSKVASSGGSLARSGTHSTSGPASTSSRL